MTCRGCTGSTEFSEKDGVFFGNVQGIRSLVSHKGRILQELQDDFRTAADETIALSESEAARDHS